MCYMNFSILPGFYCQKKAVLFMENGTAFYLPITYLEYFSA